MAVDQSSRKNVAGREDRTRDRPHTRRTRIRPSFRAQRVRTIILYSVHQPLCVTNITSGCKGHLAIKRVFSLIARISNTEFSNCPDVFLQFAGISRKVYHPPLLNSLKIAFSTPTPLFYVATPSTLLINLQLNAMVLSQVTYAAMWCI